MTVADDAKFGIRAGVVAGVLMWILALVVIYLQGHNPGEEHGLSVWDLLLFYIGGGALGGAIVGSARRYLHVKWLRFPIMFFASFVVVTAGMTALGHEPWNWSRLMFWLVIMMSTFYGALISSFR